MMRTVGETAEIPLDVQELRFRVRVKTSAGHLVRETETQVPEFIYTQTEQLSDFPVMPASFFGLHCSNRR